MTHTARLRQSPSASPLTPGEQQLLADFLSRVLATLGTARIERVVVFGSRARGDSHADSDLNLAVFTGAVGAADTRFGAKDADKTLEPAVHAGSGAAVREALAIGDPLPEPR